ncbi:MAG: HAD hydrolase-like protein [Bacteroidetes bacterium]|nr:HAD hydrolase-like protein [Bacteroidota bacterium]
MKLLLFDIDGTILKTNIGRQTIDHTLTRLCGRPISSKEVSFSGKTDPQIMQEILLHNGLSAPEAAALVPEVLEMYVEAARQTIAPHRVEVLPGVRDLIDHLAAQNTVQLALLTGNLEETAYLKLEAVGLADSENAVRENIVDPLDGLRDLDNREASDLLNKRLVRVWLRVGILDEDPDRSVRDRMLRQIEGRRVEADRIHRADDVQVGRVQDAENDR